MNPALTHLQPYPFQRLQALLDPLEAPKAKRLINLSIGEPKHETPTFIRNALINGLNNLNCYPATRGDIRLKQAIANWIEARYQMPDKSIDAKEMVIPVQGTREALFSIAQAIIDSDKDNNKAAVVMPNPFYQIYEGAAIIAQAEPVYLSCEANSQYLPNLEKVEKEIWERCQLLYLCSPHNPTGGVISESYFQQAIQLADQFDFVIASDECYSEIYYGDTPPPGILSSCLSMGRNDFSRCLAFNSLSKRSNSAGLRSGFVAGDANLLASYMQYRTYHGSAMPQHHQEASIAAWSDESHVTHNRYLYAQKMHEVLPVLQQANAIQAPSGGFCLWFATPIDSELFVKGLYKQEAVIALPGSYLARNSGNLPNPGKQYIRLALVAPISECIEASQRIVHYYQSL